MIYYFIIDKFNLSKNQNFLENIENKEHFDNKNINYFIYIE